MFTRSSSVAGMAAAVASVTAETRTVTGSAAVERMAVVEERASEAVVSSSWKRGGDMFLTSPSPP